MWSQNSGSQVDVRAKNTLVIVGKHAYVDGEHMPVSTGQHIGKTLRSNTVIESLIIQGSFEKEALKAILNSMTPSWFLHSFLPGLLARGIYRVLNSLRGLNHTINDLLIENVEVSKNGYIFQDINDPDIRYTLCKVITRNRSIQQFKLVPKNSLDLDTVKKLYQARWYNFSTKKFILGSIPDNFVPLFKDINVRNSSNLNLIKWIVRRSAANSKVVIPAILGGLLLLWEIIKALKLDLRTIYSAILRVLESIAQAYRKRSISSNEFETNFNELITKVKQAYQNDLRINKIPTLHDPIPMKKYVEQEIIPLEIMSRSLGNTTSYSILHSEPGYGKTTWLSHIVYLWTNDDPFETMKDKIVFFFTFNEILSYCDDKDGNEHDATLADFLLRRCLLVDEHTSYNRLLIEEILKNPKKVLFVIDAFDEALNKVHETKGGMIRIKEKYSILNEVFEKGSLLITSRNYAVSQLKKDIEGVIAKEGVKLKLEEMYLQGFNQTSKEKYIHVFCESLNTLVKADVCEKSAVDNLKKSIHADSFLREVTNTPLNLQLLCSAWVSWQKKGAAEQIQSVTISRFFYEAVRRQRYRYLEKKNVPIPFNPADIYLEQNSGTVTDLTRFIAYKTDGQSITNQEINNYLTQYVSNHPDIDVAHVLDDLNALGFIISEDSQCMPTLRPCDYKFAHEAYRIFLKAWHTAIDSEAMSNYEKHLRSNLNNDRLREEIHNVYEHDLMNIKFITGILTETDQKDKIKTFLKLFMVTSENGELIIDKHAAPIIIAALEEISWHKKIFNDTEIVDLKEKAFHFIKEKISPFIFLPSFLFDTKKIQDKEKFVQGLDKDYLISTFKTAYSLRQELVQELKLYGLLSSDNSNIKENTIHLLAALGENNNEFIQALMNNTLSGETEAIRVSAKNIFLNLQRESSKPMITTFLHSALESDDEKIRVNAANLLLAVSYIDSDLINQLIKNLEIVSEVEKAISVLAVISQNENHKSEIENNIINRLHTIKESPETLFLIRTLMQTGYFNKAEDYNVIKAIFNVFTTIALSNEDKISFMKELAKLPQDNLARLLAVNDDEITNLLLDHILNTDNSELKVSVIKVISSRKITVVFQKLMSLANDDNSLVRKQAFLELKCFTSAETDFQIIGFLEEKLVSEVDSSVRLIVIENLENIFERKNTQGNLVDSLLTAVSKENDIGIKTKILNLLEQIPLKKGEAIKPILNQLSATQYPKITQKANNILKKNFYSKNYKEAFKNSFIENPELINHVKKELLITESTFCALALLNDKTNKSIGDTLLTFIQEDEGLKIMLQLENECNLVSVLNDLNVFPAHLLALLSSDNAIKTNAADKLIDHYNQNWVHTDNTLSTLTQNKSFPVISELASTVQTYLKSTSYFFKPKAYKLLNGVESCIKTGKCINKDNTRTFETSNNAGYQKMSLENDDETVQTSSASRVNSWIASSTAIFMSLGKRDLLLDNPFVSKEPINLLDNYPLAIYSNQNHESTIEPEPNQQHEPKLEAEPNLNSNPSSNHFQNTNLSFTQKLMAAQYIFYYLRAYSPYTLPWNRVRKLTVAELNELIRLQNSIPLLTKTIAAQYESRTGQSQLFDDKFFSMKTKLETAGNTIRYIIKNNKITDNSFSEIQHLINSVKENIHQLAKQNKVMKRNSVKEARLERRNQRAHQYSVVETHLDIISGKQSQTVKPITLDSQTPDWSPDYSNDCPTATPFFGQRQYFWPTEPLANQSLPMNYLEKEMPKNRRFL